MAGKSISRPIIGAPKQQDSSVQSAAKSLLSWHERYHAAPNPSTTPKIKVVCIADTHNTQSRLPPGDILLHAGDLSQYGTFAEIQAQLTWLSAQPHRWKIVIAGNHDLLLDGAFVAAHPDRELEKPGRGRDDLRWGDVVYLQNSAVELDIDSRRRVKVFGSPLTPRFGTFAFQYTPGVDVWTGAVPDDTDVLLTHGPPAGHLDGGGKGCRWLLGELRSAKPRLAVFGHVHVGRGQRVLWFDGVEACYESVVRDQWPWVNLALMAWNFLWSAVWRPGAYGPQTSCSQLVNAAIVGGQHGRDTRDPIVTFV
jgi:calcineurin-like phosphoesterase family protein